VVDYYKGELISKMMRSFTKSKVEQSDESDETDSEFSSDDFSTSGSESDFDGKEDD